VAVYHFTLHAYRSWRPDHRRGYTRKGEGFQPPDGAKADEYDARAKQEKVLFDDRTQREILVISHEICGNLGWMLEAAGFDPTHAHLVISWYGYVAWEEVDRRLKNLLCLLLNRRRATPGKRWFVRRHSAPRRVKFRKHFDYLLDTYLPDHPGIFWKKGEALPVLE
jgi:hypothetical protein